MNEYKVVYYTFGGTQTEHAHGDDIAITGNPGEISILDGHDRVVAFFTGVVSATKVRAVE